MRLELNIGYIIEALGTAEEIHKPYRGNKKKLWSAY